MKKVYAFLWLAACGLFLGLPSSLYAQAPINDSPCGAINITQFDTLLVFSNRGATTQTGEDVIAPSTVGPAGLTWNESGITHSVWFTFTAPASGAVRIDLCNDSTNFDTQIAVYQVGDCANYGTYSLRGANDDIDGQCPVGDIWASTLEVSCLVPSQQYYLIVDGWLGGTTADTTGEFGMIFEEIPGSVFSVAPLGLDPVCANTNDGIAAVVATGGGAPYTYSWNGGGSNESLTGLGPGTYTVTVRDGCDSVLTSTVVLNDPGAGAELVVTSPDTALMCDGGSVNLGENQQVKGGVPLLPDNIYGFGLAAAGTDVVVGKLRKPDLANSVTNIPSIDDARCGDFAFGVFFTLNTTTDQLIAVNPATNTAQAVGNTGILAVDQAWVGMAFDQTTGTMYASTAFGNLPAALYTINLSNGNATLVDTFSGSAVIPIWLAIDNNGNMFGGDIVTDELLSINKNTGFSVNKGFTGFNMEFSNVHDADFDPATNRLYMAVANTVVTQTQLRLVDTTSGASFLVGQFPGGTLTTAFAIQESAEDAYSYTWTPINFLDDFSSANPEASPPVSFQYIATITDECGDIVKDTILVFIPDELTVSQASTPDTGSSSGSAVVTFVDGVPPYAIQWETGATTDTIVGLDGNAYYSFTASDACGTIIEDSVLVLGPSSNEELVRAGLSELEAYPNPVQNKLYIKLATLRPEDVRIELLDAKGSIVNGEVLRNVLSEETQLDMSSLSAGLYMLRIRTSEGVTYRKVLRQ